MNLRGVRESGRAFAVPTYLFVLGVVAMIGVGAARVQRYGDAMLQCVSCASCARANANKHGLGGG